MVEIALIDADGNVLLSTLLNPGRRIPENARAVHGIDDSMVAGAPAWEAVRPKVAALLNGSHLIGHNLSFDLRFLKDVSALPAMTTCTMKMARKAKIEGSLKLDRLSGLAGHRDAGFHRAAADALATRTVHLWLLGSERRSEPEPAKPPPAPSQAKGSPAPSSVAPVPSDDPRLRILRPDEIPEPAHRGRAWTPELDAALLHAWNGGADVAEILISFPRTPLAIFLRLVKLGAVAEIDNPYADKR
jgi:DNA polymerase III epsilon subunit-like protein